MKLKKLMKIFLVLFLISLFITIGLFIAAKKQPASLKPVTATVISNRETYVYAGGGRRHRYIVTVRYQGRDTEWYLSDTEGWKYSPNTQIQAYLLPDGDLAIDENDVRVNTIFGKMYWVFLTATCVLFMAFIIVYNKIWKIKHGK